MSKVPIVSPVIPYSLVKEFKQEKLLLKAQNYPRESTFLLANRFFNRIKNKIADKITPDTVLLMVPSGSMQNTLTMMLTYLAMEAFKVNALPFNIAARSSAIEAKKTLHLSKRNKAPITYMIDSERLQQGTAGKKVMIIDDVLGTGESSLRLARELEKCGVEVAGIMAPVTITNRYPSERDIERFYTKIVTLLNYNEEQGSKLKADLVEAFGEYTIQRLNRVEREVKDIKSAAKAVNTISMAASIERSLKDNDIDRIKEILHNSEVKESKNQINIWT